MKKRLGFLLSATVILVSAALVGCQGGRTGETQKWDKVFNYYSHSNSGTYVGCTYPEKTFYWLAIGY